MRQTGGGAFLAEQEVLSHKLQEVLDHVDKSLNYSIESVSMIHEESLARYQELLQDLDRVQRDIEDVIKANDEANAAYRMARNRLAEAAVRKDEERQRNAYDEAERLMRLKGSFEERERMLRARREELQRDVKHMESILHRSVEMIQKIRVAMEVIHSRMEDMQDVTQSLDAKSLMLALQFVERDRLRLARDIHDGPAQQFSGVLLLLEMAQRLEDLGEKSRAAEELAKARNTLGESLGDMRTLLWQLRPVGIGEGLRVVLQRFTDQVKGRYAVSCVLRMEGNDARVGQLIAANAFRIVQEAVSNAVLKGRARNIAVSCSVGNDVLRLKIVDDGCGFDVEAVLGKVRNRECYGLENMQERARLAGGTFRIESEPERGTKVTVELPLWGGNDDGKNPHSACR